MGLTTLRAGRWLARRYPEEWQQRHGVDLEEFLDVRGVRNRDLLSLCLGLVDAHVQVLGWKEWWPAMNRHVTRGLVLSAAAVVLLLVEGGALAKTSEDGAVASLDHHDAAALVGLRAVEVAALLAAVVVALASVRALAQVTRSLVADRDLAGLAALVAPLIICAALLVELLVVARLADGHQVVAVTLLAASGVVGVVLALWCLAVALRRAEVDAVPARPAGPAAAVLAGLAVLALLGEGIWASRVVTLPAWSSLAGVVSLPMAVTFVGAAACSVVAVTLALVARSEIARSDLA